MIETITGVIAYIVVPCVVALITGGITYFWQHRDVRNERNRKIDSIAKDIKELKEDFSSVKNCTRLTSKTYLAFYTKYFSQAGGIPLKSRAILSELARELHGMGENGEVTVCEEELEKIPTNEEIEIK